MNIIRTYLIVLFFLIMNLLTNSQNKTKMEIATFGSGCFWCSEAIFEQLQGVETVESGYSGGKTVNPSYKDVCTGETGHAEVIQVTFNPEIISYKELLEVFWQTHDPTTINRQGADVGTQYRSVIFYHNDIQNEIAHQYLKKLDDARIYGKPIVTEISPIKIFYKAENYHQDYYNNNKFQSYCSITITPKLDKFKKVFKEKLK